MSTVFKKECPKCYTDRTMLDTSFALPGYRHPDCPEAVDNTINLKCALPVRIVLCPRCHLLEMYHDVG